MIRITAALIGAAFAASGAIAQDQQYFTCSTQYGASPNVTVYVSEVFRYEYALGDKAASDFKSYLTERYGFKTYANCPAFPGADQATKHFEYVQSYALKNNARVSIERWAPAGASSAEIMAASPKPSPQSAAAAPTATHAAPQKYVEVDGPNGKMRLSPEVAARNQAAAEEYRRKMEEHARAKAAHEQRLAQHRQNADTAAAAKEQHGRELAAAAERLATHRLALAEHAKKVAGASTNDDPNRCITSPAIKPGLRGNTEVHVTNGCDQKVDIVICLKRTTGDWLCGARFGILSQRSISFMSTNATGEIYVDAVTFGSKNKLGRPAGIIK